MDTELLQKYIAGNATESEKKLVTEWIQANSENMREYMTLRKLYDISLWHAEPEAEKHPVGKRIPFWHRMGKEVTKVAAIFVIVFCSTYFWFKKHQPQESVRFQSVFVPAGQRAELMLADGTKVWLNSRTTLVFPSNFQGDVRHVKLDGEGYFAVAKNAERPFVVETHKCNVKVLGTEFDVMAYAADSIWETSLLQGSVEVLIPGHANGGVKLEPNTMVSLKGNKLVKGQVREPDYFLWREGLLCFNNITVRDIIEKLKLYYGVDIVVNNKAILENRYMGKFRTKDGVEHVLKVLKLNNKFTYTKDDETNVITIN